MKKYLLEGKRFDGRGLEEYRDLIIEKNVSVKAEGSVKVTLGKTQVVAGVKMSVVEPYGDSPTKGNLMVTAELSPLSSRRFEAGPPRFNAIELGRVTDRGLRESGFIDFDKLCIKEGEKVWNIFVDIYSLNDDGNLMDAATIAAIAALKIAKIPEYDEKTDKINYEKLTDKNIPLTDHVPIAVSVHKLGKSLIVDPTREEEDVSEARVTIGSSNGTISSLQKSNSAGIPIEEMKKIFEISTKISKEIFWSSEEIVKVWVFAQNQKILYFVAQEEFKFKVNQVWVTKFSQIFSEIFVEIISGFFVSIILQVLLKTQEILSQISFQKNNIWNWNFRIWNIFIFLFKIQF